MAKLTTPCLSVKKLWNIDLDELKRQGMTILLMDMDNTIVPWHSFVVPEKARQWVLRAKKLGFDIYLLSNNVHSRVLPLAKDLGVEAVANACKPWRRGLRRLQKLYEIDLARAVMIGDQVFTDIVAGNSWGVKTILVDPLVRREGRMTWFARTLEKGIMKRKIDFSGGED
ncbi:MAG: YqeG family HAD IIIA-type phosphatase [Eubacteriales bacterium]|nr:YqeG family HAD IIIA-type phosphatase [Eubacteriales bacterium]